MNIQNVLNDWGKAQRHMPENAGSQKAKILASFELTPKIHNRRFSFRLPIYALSSAGLVLLVVVIYGFNAEYKTSLKGSNLSQTTVSQNTQDLPRASVDSYLEKDKKTQTMQGLSLDASAPTANTTEGRANKSAPRIDSEIQNERMYQNSEPAYKPSGAIKDTREFLKINYSVNLNVRDVYGTSDMVQNSVNNLNGRVDSVSVSESQSYINFVVPKTNFEAFKIKLKNQVGDRFYIESTQSSNLLPQKQVIEKNTKTTQSEIQNLKNQQTELIAEHQRTVASLNGQIYSLNKELTQVLNELKVNSMNADLQNRQQALKTQISNLNYSLSQENYYYQESAEELSYEIDSQQKRLVSLNEQDVNLQDNVETVEGRVIINKISLVEYVNAFVPFYLSVPITFIIICAAYFLFRKPKIVLP